MSYRIINLSYDFGQRRTSASVQSMDSGGFISINFSTIAPDNISAAQLNDNLVAEVRKELEKASKFAQASGQSQ